MFVESMTMKEIREEFERERKSVLNKVIHAGKHHAKHMRQYNILNYDKVESFTSARKNKWFVIWTCPQPGYRNLAFELFSFFYTRRSYAVVLYGFQSNNLYYYTSHFFTRYNERMKLEAKVNIDVIIRFMRENFNIAHHRIKEMESGIDQIFGQTRQGVSLGYEYHQLNLLELRTFITNDMLKGSQVELSKTLEQMFNLEVIRDNADDTPPESQ